LNTKIPDQDIKKTLEILDTHIPDIKEIKNTLKTYDTKIVLLEIQTTLETLGTIIPDLQDIKKTLDILDKKIPDTQQSTEKDKVWKNGEYK